MGRARMRNLGGAVLVAVALSAASTAAAQVSFDVKAAYALPMRDGWASSPWNPALPMTSSWSGAIPFELAARYHVTPNASVGAYFQWGPAFAVNPGFGGLATSWGFDMRTGLQLMYEILPASTLNPWFSLGTGWEWTNYSGSGYSVTMNGWEWFNFQVGLDLKPADAFGLGPYVGFFAGDYANMVATGSAQGGGGAIPSYARSFHGWLQFGVKGTLNL